MSDLLRRKTDHQLGEKFRCLALFSAASYVGDTGLVSRLLDRCKQITRQDLYEPLASAIHEGHDGTALLLIEKGANGNGDSMKGVGAPLSYALLRQNHVVFEALLEADVNANLGSPMAIAAGQNDMHSLKMLIALGADVDSVAESSTETALTVAVSQHNEEMVHVLLNAGADINNPHARRAGRTALGAAVRNGDEGMIELLLSHGADPDDKGALSAAIEHGLQLTQRLIDAYDSRYTVKKPGFAAEVLCAAMHNKPTDSTLKLLLKQGADVNWLVNFKRSIASKTAFGKAIERAAQGDDYFVHLLMRYGAHIKSVVTRDERLYASGFAPRETALLYAVKTGSIRAVRLLIVYGADVNRPAVRGVKRTPLQEAAEMQDMDMVSFLLARNADVNAPPAARGGATALHLAAISGLVGLASLLVACGADVNAQRSQVYGRTALEGAAGKGRFAMVQYLIDMKVNTYSEFGQRQLNNAIRLAKQEGHRAVQRLLESRQKAQGPATLLDADTQIEDEDTRSEFRHEYIHEF